MVRVRVRVACAACAAASAEVNIFEINVMGVPVRPLTTLGVRKPFQDRRIELPDEMHASG